MDQNLEECLKRSVDERGGADGWGLMRETRRDDFALLKCSSHDSQLGSLETRLELRC